MKLLTQPCHRLPRQCTGGFCIQGRLRRPDLVQSRRQDLQLLQLQPSRRFNKWNKHLTTDQMFTVCSCHSTFQLLRITRRKPECSINSQHIASNKPKQTLYPTYIIPWQSNSLIILVRPKFGRRYDFLGHSRTDAIPLQK